MVFALGWTNVTPRDPTSGNLADAEKIAVLSSLNRVGPTKAIGYLPLYTITNVLQLVPETLATQAEARGLAAILLGPEQCCIKSGALYVYDRDALASILQDAADPLVRLNVPLDPDPFVQHIAANWFEPDHPVCAIIAIAFADKL